MDSTEASATAKMASYLSRLNPVPAFPEYTGPYKVGSIDIEIPVAELDSPSPTPSHAQGIHTVQYRVFYPATRDSEGKHINWLPAPQRTHVSAYTQFLGVGPILAEVVSFLPRHLHYTSIPALKNATLLEPNTPSGRWPTMIFSHGLGGSRNAYSHVAGSVASHGVVVICPEHRDGSSVVSFVRDPAAQNRFFKRSTRSMIPYNRIPHKETPEVFAARDQQLRIRLWELGLVHDSILRLDEASAAGAAHMTNLNGSTPAAVIAQFANKLEVHNPGDIIWAGHSFGSTSVVQLLKTTFYADTLEVAAIKEPLYTPRPFSRLRAQICEKSPAILLDMWCFSLLSPTQQPLFKLPLPMYADLPSALGGNGVLAVGSETFYKWTPHLHVTAKVLSPDPSAEVVSPAAYVRPSGVRQSEPNFFYVEHSAHLNQSDFGLLFPWLTSKVFGAQQPERCLRLNLRAILQMLRINGVPVARTWVGDLVDGSDVDKLGNALSKGGDQVGDKGPTDGIDDDKAILERGGSSNVECWSWIDIVGMGAESADNGKTLLRTPERDGVDAAVAAADYEGEQSVEGEMAPRQGTAAAADAVSATA